MNNIFYILVAGFTSGIFISSFFKLGFFFFLFLLILAIIIFVYNRFIVKTKIIFLVLLPIFIFSFALGILRYEIKDIRSENDILSELVGQKVALEGVIVDEPNIKEQNVQLVVASENITTLNQVQKATGKVLVIADLFPEFKYGDQVKISGKLERPTNFSTTTGNDFDYVGFLAKDDIYYQMNFVQAEVISGGHGTFIKTKLLAIKNAFIKKINLLIKEPESSLLSGLLLGAKNSLGKEWQTDFRQAGVSHIVALSGYNITIVAESIMVALSFLPRAFSMSFGVLGIIAFALMTGGSATVLRASVMALLVLLARATGRKYDISRALLLAGVFMLIQNPKILVFDVSFQLSFLSTLALILVSPLVEKKVIFITEKYKLRELTVATISTQIFVLPFLLFKMGMLSVFGLFANVLILPLIPLIMLFGFITGILGFFSTTLAVPVAFVSSILLSYALSVIYFFSHLPFASLSIQNFSLGLAVIIYVVYLVIIWQSMKTTKDIYEKN